MGKSKVNINCHENQRDQDDDDDHSSWLVEVWRDHQSNMSGIKDDDPSAQPAAAPVELAPPVTSSTSPPTDGPAPPTSSLDPEEIDRLRRVPFGSRYLTNPEDVYSFNAWDHVVPPPEWEVQAKQTLGIQREGKVSEEMKCASHELQVVLFSMSLMMADDHLRPLCRPLVSLVSGSCRTV